MISLIFIVVVIAGAGWLACRQVSPGGLGEEIT